MIELGIDKFVSIKKIKVRLSLNIIINNEKNCNIVIIFHAGTRMFLIPDYG